jgi:polysaccharide biosynthesis transport protein
MVRDVELHDRAFPPQTPSSDQRLRLALMMLAASVGLSVSTGHRPGSAGSEGPVPQAGDRRDRARDPGDGPRILNGQKGSGARENREQVLEAFRDLRLNMEYAYGSAGPLLVTISSPGQSEGKSLISTNLALAFAEMGRRPSWWTATRAGEMRIGSWACSASPGLTDILQRTVEARDAIQVTEYPSWTTWPPGAGSQLPGAPQYHRCTAPLCLAPGALPGDPGGQPALAAGSDAFVLSSITGNLAMVLRHGASDRGLIQARIESIHRLPIRVLGAIMNDVEVSGSLQVLRQLPPRVRGGLGVRGRCSAGSADGREPSGRLKRRRAPLPARPLNSPEASRRGATGSDGEPLWPSSGGPPE